MSREKANLHDFLTEEGNAPREKKFYRVLPSPEKYSFVSSTTLPESRKSAIRFGIALFLLAGTVVKLTQEYFAGNDQ